MSRKLCHPLFLIGLALLLFLAAGVGAMWWRSYHVDYLVRIDRPSPDYAAGGRFRVHRGVIEYRWPQQYAEPAVAGWEVRYWQLMLIPSMGLLLWSHWWWRRGV